VNGLPPRIHPLVRSFLSQEETLSELLQRRGSPLNVVFPEIFRANVAAFRRVLDPTGLRYRICYAHKASQARAFVRAALAEDTGIDVASPGELHSALAAGFPAERVEVTGPKGRSFLSTLVTSGATINADNLWELSEIIRLVRARGGGPVPVLARLCGFGSAARPVSRFGIPAARFGEVTSLLSASRDAVDFLGLSFHLDTGEVRDRVQAADGCLELFERSWAAGLAPRVLDIGGGFRQAFAERGEPFEEYALGVRRGLAGEGPPLTWNGATLGYRYTEGGIRGGLMSGKYSASIPGSDLLREVLASPLPGQGGRTLTRVLRENMIDLWLEPGKSLADHAGLTLASVEFVKEASDGSILVNLDISRDKISPADQEVLLDPVLIYRSDHGGQDRPAGIFFAGNLCLERDMIFNHLTFVDRIPEPGDIVAFVNTAAYQTDLSASAALMRPPPRRAVAWSDKDGFTVHTDD
jgi:diaminopimelate decarboxylase